MDEMMFRMGNPPGRQRTIFAQSQVTARVGCDKSGRVAAEMGVHQRDRDDRRIARKQNLPARQIG